MKENFEGNSKKEDDKKMNRRDFLKVAGALAGSVLVGGGIGTFLKEDSKKHERLGEGIVVSKNHRPQGLISVKLLVPEMWSVSIFLDGKESVITVEKNVFDSLKEGDKVSVFYDDRDKTVRSIKKE